MYKIKITKRAIKDINSLTEKGRLKLKEILVATIAQRPRVGKKLVGELQGNYSFRLDLKNRIVYSIDEEERVVYIKRARTHYGKK